MSGPEPGPRARILVVDDERIVCASCERILGAEGHEVSSTQDPADGLRRVRDEAPDLAILDLKMPGMNGIELLRRIKELGVATEVMIVTGYAEIQTAVQAMKLGAFDYIPKPFTPDQLVIAVAKVLERKRLHEENAWLRRELRTQYRFDNISGHGQRMQEVYRLIERVAPTHSTVLIRGESGTGKELIARAIHWNSPRRDHRFVPIDCGALSETVLESEMFGHVRGAFTGAVSARKGFFELADGGTLFLDEIGNVSLKVQTRLLRVLQEREFKPVGATHAIATDVRVVAATNKDLEALVAAGAFREELYYRLNIVPIQIPPLRERAEDLPELCRHFLEKHREAAGSAARRLSPEALELVLGYAWPGNVRELENAIQRALVLCPGEVVLPAHLPPELSGSGPAAALEVPRTWEDLKQRKQELRERNVEELERRFLEEALARAAGNVSRAADEVGMQRTNFHALMRRHQVVREGG